MRVQEPATIPIELRFASRAAAVGYILMFCVALVGAPVSYFIYKSPEFTIISIGFSVAYLLCFIAASLGFGLAARPIFLFITALHYAVSLLWFGPNAGIQAYISCMMATPMIIYARKELIATIAALLLFLLSITIGEYVARSNASLLNLDANAVSFFYISNMVAAGVFMTFLLLVYSRSSMKSYIELQIERAKSEGILRDLVPAVVADQMIRGETITAQSQGECSVLFADIVGFTKLATVLSPVHLVEVLNGLFSDIDQLCDRHGIEKIKTIGDCYMAATGVFAGQNRPAELALAGLAIVEIVQDWAAKIGRPLQVRVGISTGQVISGVIGRKRPLFDIWGQTVNIAKQMEAKCVGDQVLVSEATFYRLNNRFDFEPFDTITTKSGDTLKAFRLIGPKAGDKNHSDDLALTRPHAVST